MFQDLRTHYKLTRSQLSALTGRSPNYILKAESLTFPSPPVSLLDFYTSEAPPKDWARLSEVEWEPMDRDILNSQYRDAQRSRRELWLDIFEPNSNNQNSFCRQWVMRDYQNDMLFPTEYRTSQGLCVPAPAVYRAEKFGHISQPIRTALSDLVDYIASGRYTAKHLNAIEDNTITGVLTIAKKYGVVPYHV